MRDFYDIYILHQLHGKNLESTIFSEALRATAYSRGTENHISESYEVFDDIENSFIMKKLWLSYQRKFSYAAELEWSAIMAAVREVYSLAKKV